MTVTPDTKTKKLLSATEVQENQYRYCSSSFTKQDWLDRMGSWYWTIPESGCWIWMRSSRPPSTGSTVLYGLVWDYDCRRAVRAHRVSYGLLVGPIPDGLCIDHLCRTTLCVNPDHLQPVTLGENVLRGIGRTAKNKRKTHCNNGHEFTPETTWVWGPKLQWRRCRICAVKATREWRASRRCNDRSS